MPRPYRFPAVLRLALEKSLSERHGRSTAGAWHWHGHGMVCVHHARPHTVNEMGKTQSKILATRHGRGKAWPRQGHGTLYLN